MTPLKNLISFRQSQVPTMRRASGAEAVAASWQGLAVEIAYGLDVPGSGWING